MPPVLAQCGRKHAVRYTSALQIGSSIGPWMQWEVACKLSSASAGVFLGSERQEEEGKMGPASYAESKPHPWFVQDFLNLRLLFRRSRSEQPH